MRDGKVDLPETLKELMPIFRETEYYTLASLVEQCGGAIASLGGGPEFDKFRGIIPTVSRVIFLRFCFKLWFRKLLFQSITVTLTIIK